MLKPFSAGLALTALLAGPALAETYEVKMLNQDPETGRRMAFQPSVLRIQPGDTVRFVPADRGHNSQLIDNMLPAGGTQWRGKLGREIEVTFETEGTFGYKCQPHYATGMVGLILVGDASVNMDEAKAVEHRGKAKERFADLFAEAGTMMAAD